MNTEEFLKRNRISKEDWHKADIAFEELVKIESDYRSKIPYLNESAEFLARVLQKCDQVHSVRWRVKDPEHMLEKIVRKKAAGSSKYREVTVENYSELITDFVGVRVLHLFKQEWLDIHQYIQKHWAPIEDVVAYIREGDKETIVEDYKANNCRVEVHPAGYRSIHYIISSQPTLAKVISEVQVRTIFEEGWSEIDHKVRYPNYMSNKLVSYFLTIFNRMSGSADEMGTFVNDLVSDIKWKELQFDVNKKEQEDHLQKIEKLVQELSKANSVNAESESKFKKLEEELASIKRNSIQLPSINYLKIDDETIRRMSSLSREALKFSNLANLNTSQLEAIKLSDISKFSLAHYDILKNLRPLEFIPEDEIKKILPKKPKNTDQNEE